MKKGEEKGGKRKDQASQNFGPELAL